MATPEPTTKTFGGKRMKMDAASVKEREYQRAWKARYRARNGAEYREYMRRWRKAHPGYKTSPEKSRARYDRYRRANLKKYAAKEARRRSIRRANGGSHTERDWQKLLHRYNGICAYCQRAAATTRDHIIPVKLGGTGYIGNIAPACYSCNASKQDTLAFKWRNRCGYRYNY